MCERETLRLLYLKVAFLLLISVSATTHAACLVCQPQGGGSSFNHQGSYCPSGTSQVGTCTAPTPTLPGAPQLSFSMSSLSVFELSWLESSIATSYQYRSRIAGGTWSGPVVASGNPLELSRTVEGTYDYQVRGCNNAGCGTYSLTIKIPIILPVLDGSGATFSYSYDSLGRLTLVQDPVNGNRDYDYDKAGNRTEMSVGNEYDTPLFNPPASPTGLSCSQIAPNVYRASWNSVSGASYYLARSNATSNAEVSTSSTSTVFSGSTCKWVRSCNSLKQCSAKNYF